MNIDLMIFGLFLRSKLWSRRNVSKINLEQCSPSVRSSPVKIGKEFLLIITDGSGTTHMIGTGKSCAIQGMGPILL